MTRFWTRANHYAGLSVEAGMRAMAADIARLKLVRGAPEVQGPKRRALARILRLNGGRLTGLSAANLEEIIAGRR